MSPRPAPSPGGITAPRRRTLRRFLWIAACAALAAAAALYTWQTRALPIVAVTVAPLTSEGAPDWLAAALSEEVADALRPALMDSADPRHRAILEGRVSRSGNRVRVIATLTRGDGHRYWTKTIDRPAVDIARELAAAIVPSVRKKAIATTKTPAAYDLFLQGRRLFAERDYAKAADAFDAAAESDPAFARAFAWAALAREALADQGAARSNDVLPAARDAAERAVTLDPTGAEAHLALGVVKLQYDWDWDAARRELDRALELGPRHPLAVEWKNRWLTAMNRAPAAPLEFAILPQDADAARQVLAQADELRAQNYVTPLQFALAAQVAHDSDSVFHWLDVAYDERCAQLPYLIRSPALPQSDPRLRDLLRRLKLPANP